MRNVILLAERRDHDQWHPKSGEHEIAGWSLLGGIATNINIGRGRIQIDWLDSVRTHRGLRRNMIIKAARFIPGQNKNSILPRWALHKRIDQALDIRRSYLFL